MNGSNPKWAPDGARIAYTFTPPAAAGAATASTAAALSYLKRPYLPLVVVASVVGGTPAAQRLIRRALEESLRSTVREHVRVHPQPDEARRRRIDTDRVRQDDRAREQRLRQCHRHR